MIDETLSIKIIFKKNISIADTFLTRKLYVHVDELWYKSNGII